MARGKYKKKRERANQRILDKMEREKNLTVRVRKIISDIATDTLRTMTDEELLNMQGIGPAAVKQIRKWLEETKQ